MRLCARTGVLNDPKAFRLAGLQVAPDEIDILWKTNPHNTIYGNTITCQENSEKTEKYLTKGNSCGIVKS